MHGLASFLGLMSNSSFPGSESLLSNSELEDFLSRKITFSFRECVNKSMVFSFSVGASITSSS